MTTAFNKYYENLNFSLYEKGSFFAHEMRKLQVASYGRLQLPQQVNI